MVRFSFVSWLKFVLTDSLVLSASKAETKAKIMKSPDGKRTSESLWQLRNLHLGQVQLEKVRQQVKNIRTNLVRGLHFVQSLVAARVEELQLEMSSIISLPLKEALNRGSFLAGETAFATYLVCSSFLIMKVY